MGVEKTWGEYTKLKDAAKPLTREEMVVLLVNVLGADLTDVQSSVSFKDNASISPNARAAVAYAVNIGLIKGVDGNKFRSKSNFNSRADGCCSVSLHATHEQDLITKIKSIIKSISNRLRLTFES